jgi:CDP-4-dehydro-6-deoxyglucose reductase
LFAGLTANAASRPAEPIGASSRQVRVLPAGESFSCPADKSILDAAHAANVLLAYSCRSGQCRSCIGRVIDGEIRYPGGLPPAISKQESESGLALFCSAFAVSDLTIEILKPEF